MTLYGYFRNPCIHESAAGLVSLHTSKVGAWKAKHAAMFAAVVEHREFGLTFAGRPWLRGKALQYEEHFIASVKVLP